MTVTAFMRMWEEAEHLLGRLGEAANAVDGLPDEARVSLGRTGLVAADMLGIAKRTNRLALTIADGEREANA